MKKTSLYILLATLAFAVIYGFRPGVFRPKVKMEVVQQSEKIKFRIDTIVSGLMIPWGMDWLPNGDLLITDKIGQLRRIKDGKLMADPVSGLPEIYVSGQGGLMDVKLHPDYARNGWIYLTYSTPEGSSGRGGNTALMRAKLKDNALVEKQVLFKASPNTTRGQHFGSRIEFDRDGYLYFSVGDRGERDKAQRLDTHNGKIFRLNDDGSIPDDNPFAKKSGAEKAVFSYGHRNPQGLALHPETGELWATEHGPRGGDELNIVRKGRNYGWPEITYGINYNGTTISEFTAKEGMEQPVHYWTPSIAPCGTAFVTGSAYPAWKGNVLVGSLSFRYLERCEIKGEKVTHREKLLEGIGRVRNVKQGPDGYIYVAVELPGVIVRLLPE